jgi:uncharacterized protein
LKENIKIPISELGFDFDGVFANIGEVFVRLACEEYNYCSFSLEDLITFKVEECIAMPAHIVEAIFNDILEDSLATKLQPMEGVLEVVNDLALLGPITIVTARSKAQPVHDWLSHFFPEKTCRQINLIAMGDHDDKVRYIKKLNIKHFIDDRLETCHQMEYANITPYIFSHPWNHIGHNFKTVSNWDDIRILVQMNKET